MPNTIKDFTFTFQASLVRHTWFCRTHLTFNRSSCRIIYTVTTSEMLPWSNLCKHSFLPHTSSLHSILNCQLISFLLDPHTFLTTLLSPTLVAVSSCLCKRHPHETDCSEGSWRNTIRITWISDLVECEVHNEHLALVVDLLHFHPAEVVGLAGALEGQDATVVDAEVQLIAPVVLQQGSSLQLSA